MFSAFPPPVGAGFHPRPDAGIPQTSRRRRPLLREGAQELGVEASVSSRVIRLNIRVRPSSVNTTM